jgi:glycine betaine/proline transport system substrate-binding protein
MQRIPRIINIVSSVSRRTVLKGIGAAGVALGAPGFASAAPAQTMRYMVAPWADGLAVTHVAAALLEEAYGYKINILQTEVAIAYASLAEGKGDVWSLGFFEGEDNALKGDFKSGHASYMEKVGSKIDVLGNSSGPMDIGFAVPDYVDVTTPDGLNENSDKFGAQIIGIDAGSGLMQAADRAVQEYGLKLKVLPGSDAAMLASLKRAVAREEWIVVAAYSPHPMWSLGLHYIDDPKNIFGDPHYFFTVARKGFKKDFPEAVRFFAKYHLPNDATSQIMAWTDEGMQPRDAALKWIAANRGKGLIESWLS